MDDKRTEAVTEEDDFSELFGVSYFSDEPEDVVSSEEQTEEGAEQTAEGEDEDPIASEEDPQEGTTEEAEEGSETDPEADNAGEDTEEAEEADETEEVGAEDPKPADDAAAILEAIRAVDPAIETFNDLEDVGLFALLIDQGRTPEEALRESSPKLQAKLVQAQKVASKKHLRATGNSGRDDAVDMDAIKAFRRMYPNSTEKEATEYFKRVNARK